MKRYKFTATAEKDLLGIVDYSLEKWGDIKAAQYVDGLESFASNLANNPNVGLYQGDKLKWYIAFYTIGHKRSHVPRVGILLA